MHRWRKISLMIKGICPKCGAHVIGWSLAIPKNQICLKCGVSYKLIDDNRPTGEPISDLIVETKPADKSVTNDA